MAQNVFKAYFSFARCAAQQKGYRRIWPGHSARQHNVQAKQGGQTKNLQNIRKIAEEIVKHQQHKQKLENGYGVKNWGENRGKTTTKQPNNQRQRAANKNKQTWQIK